MTRNFKALYAACLFPHVQLPPPVGSVLFRNSDLFAFSWRQLNFDEVNEECDSERFVKLWKYAKIIVLIRKVSQKPVPSEGSYTLITVRSLPNTNGDLIICISTTLHVAAFTQAN